MNLSEIWTGIIIPLLVGPIFIYIKTVYDNYTKNKREHKLELYNLQCNNLKSSLNNFYWPFYIKLLCIDKLNYKIPLKNDYEYISDDEEDEEEINPPSKNDNDNVVINMTGEVSTDLVLDKGTIQLMENNINDLFKEALTILENNMYMVKMSESLNENLIDFIKFCKIRSIIHENSINKKYNIKYFDVIDNTKEVIKLLKIDLDCLQNDYTKLIDKGP